MEDERSPEALIAQVQELAELSPLAYELRRLAISDEWGVRVATIDAEVQRVRNTKDEVSPQTSTVELWTDPVDGPTLLGTIYQELKTYLDLDDDAFTAIPLWVVYTHLYDLWDISPRLNLKSPTHGCGKSSLVTLIEACVERPLKASSASPAVIYRAVDKEHPTLILDEADTFLVQDPAFRGVLNSGHRRGDKVLRCGGDDHHPEAFEPFGPLVVSLIGSTWPALRDRSIVIDLQRKRIDNELPKPKQGKHLNRLGQMAARWAADNRSRLVDHIPTIPSRMGDRAKDNWFPLLAIAEVVGGGWAERARDSALALSKVDPDDEDIKIQLLIDIFKIFQKSGADGLPSEDLARTLCSMEDRPWIGADGVRPLSKASLARMLGPFKIRPVQARFEYEPQRGYYRRQFEDAWARYLPVDL